MNVRFKTAFVTLLLVAAGADRAAWPAPRPVIRPEALTQAIASHLMEVPEFKFIRERAHALGIRVWLFGGTAAAYGHYVKWDLQRKSGDSRFQADRFDYDYTNIYRSTQDLDIVVDGTPDQAAALEGALKAAYPHFQGSKSAWEVRLLKEGRDSKEALLDNPDYLNQHTDSNSTGMIELSVPPEGEVVVRDLRDWSSKEPHFLRDVAEGKIHYYFSEKHTSTARAKRGDNPEIFSVIRLLIKAFQYELELRAEDWNRIQSAVDRLDPALELKSDYSRQWIEKNAKKLNQNAVNVEYAWNTLQTLGLRQKLIGIRKDPATQDSLAWWMGREPLRSQELGATGRTARQIFEPSDGASIVLSHETGSFLAYESITRAHTGDPNALISRNGHEGESAIYGEGFYTRTGRVGAGDTGRTIRMILDPNAREGADFSLAGSDYVVIRNKRAIRVIPEDLKMSFIDYFRLLTDGKSIDPSDRWIYEKLKRRLSSRSHAISEEEKREITQLAVEHLRNVPSPSDV